MRNAPASLTQSQFRGCPPVDALPVKLNGHASGELLRFWLLSTLKLTTKDARHEGPRPDQLRGRGQHRLQLWRRDVTGLHEGRDDRRDPCAM